MAQGADREAQIARRRTFLKSMPRTEGIGVWTRQSLVRFIFAGFACPISQNKNQSMAAEHKIEKRRLLCTGQDTIRITIENWIDLPPQK